MIRRDRCFAIKNNLKSRKDYNLNYKRKSNPVVTVPCVSPFALISAYHIHFSSHQRLKLFSSSTHLLPLQLCQAGNQYANVTNDKQRTIMHQPSSIVIYDGMCGICDALRQRAVRRDRFRRLEFVPYQTADLAQLAPGLTREQASRALVIVLPDGSRHYGARAFFETMRHLPGLWHALGTAGSWPPIVWLAEPVYRMVAHHRARISRWLGLNACAIVPPAR